jgi:hypothetical protein
MAPTRTEETGRAGPGSSAGLGCAAGKGEDGLGLSGCGLVFFFFFFIYKSYFQTSLNIKQTSNSNRDLNPTTKNHAPACMQQ